MKRQRIMCCLSNRLSLNIVGLICLGLILSLQRCSGPLGTAAKYEAKKISPVHNTKIEKAEENLGKVLGSDDGNSD